MPWPKYWIQPNGDQLYVGNETTASLHSPDEFLRIFDETQSLGALRRVYPASRNRLISALEHFGRDPVGIIKGQIKAGHSDTELAAMHAVDAKWIANLRAETGVSPLRGRPTTRVSNDQVAEAVQRLNKNMTAVGGELGIDRRTVAARWRKIVAMRRR